MKVILIRHGQSTANEREIAQGWLDTPLTETGMLQARRVAEKLSHEHITAVYTSDLTRAVQTALPIAQTQRLPLLRMPVLREVRRGRFEGRKKGSLGRHIVQIGSTFVRYREHNVESARQLLKRARRFWSFLLKHHAHDTVVVVSHGAFLTRLFLWLDKKHDKMYAQYHPENCAVAIWDTGVLTRCIY